MNEHESAGPAAVIVIDLQTAMFDGVLMPPIHNAAALVDHATRVIGWARRTGRKIAFIWHEEEAGQPLAVGAPGWPIWPALGQGPDEPVFSKNGGDAFTQPALVAWLASQGANEVILLGAQTDQCVAATVTGAQQRGLTVTVVRDAHGTWDFGGETADQIIARHNILFAAAGARLTTVKDLTGGR